MINMALIFGNEDDFRSSTLENIVLPYIKASESMQSIFDEMLGRRERRFKIRFIRSSSDITIGLDGAAEIYRAVREDVSKWRRTNAQNLAALQESILEAHINNKTAEALEKRIRSYKIKAQASKLRAEAKRIRAEAKRQEIENQDAMFELDKKRLDLALELAGKINPGIPQAELIAYAVRLLPDLRIITDQPVDAIVLVRRLEEKRPSDEESR